MLTIRTLGGLTVRGPAAGAEPAESTVSPRVLALAALLGTAADRGVDPERVRTLLGPGAGAENPVPPLLDELRRQLDPFALLSIAPIRLDPDVVRADVTDFERALDERDAARAVELYTGDFLDGFHLPDAAAFNDWAARERSRLARLHRIAQATLALRTTPVGRTASVPAIRRDAPRRDDDRDSMTGTLSARVPDPRTRERGAVIAGRYIVERELGHGALAAVLLARDTKHDRQVAVKFVRAELADALSLERFQSEIALLARLQHPHILPLYDSGNIAGSLYYVMPFVDGETLRDRLARERVLPVDDAVRLALEVADALEHAHAHGVVHRDIKPENILLANGHALVVDFGVARAMHRAGTRRLTTDGYAVGTPAYMSPEQASGDPVDARSDVYSLGCVLYEMIGGRPPFAGPGSGSLLVRRLTQTPPSLCGLRDGVPPGLDAVVARALLATPGDRFQTVTEMARALESTRVAAVTPAGPATPVAEQPAARPARRPWDLLRRLFGAAVIAAALVGGASRALWR